MLSDKPLSNINFFFVLFSSAHSLFPLAFFQQPMHPTDLQCWIDLCNFLGQLFIPFINRPLIYQSLHLLKALLLDEKNYVRIFSSCHRDGAFKLKRMTTNILIENDLKQNSLHNAHFFLEPHQYSSYPPFSAGNPLSLLIYKLPFQ